jgi:ornithine carbamoyltransferase
MRHLNSLLELTADDVEAIFRLTRSLKERWQRGDRPQLLTGRVMTQVFEKPSLRTRVSFEAAMLQLGGSSIFLSAKDAGLGGREAAKDIARVLGGYNDVIVLRTFSQKLIDEFIRYSGTHVINGLSDTRHPCQALTDLYTMSEVFGDIRGKKFVFVGDANNVATSLASICTLLEVPFTVCSPENYRLPRSFLAELRRHLPDAQVTQTANLRTALADAAVVYTDVWTSMGQEAEEAQRRKVFGPFQINAGLMQHAPPTAKFMHCLPAKRGLEVTDDVLDGPRSLVWQQADNRMHVAKGILCWVLGTSP